MIVKIILMNYDNDEDENNFVYNDNNDEDRIDNDYNDNEEKYV